MNRGGVRQLAVVERGEARRFVGIITMADIIRAQAKAIEDTGKLEVSERGEIHSTLSGPR